MAEAGFSEYPVKPFEAQELYVLLERLLPKGDGALVHREAQRVRV